MKRPSIDQYLMGIAEAASLRSTCNRAMVGAVLTRDGKILATGYNGSISGLEHCSENDCYLIDGHCARTLHAEVNAILQASQPLVGATIYCTLKPCLNCTKIILQAGITRIVYKNFYDSYDFTDLLIEEKGVKIEQF